uniref:Nudix hydrolase domain-containing protein n=1 Tax=Ditylum brightwellii TaxID=49249 RepID=A0A7S4QSH4_9STRA|mmetsp:Transcript_56586/g.84167  ORF Transcript_56586/g.84167 Transcript_56586/m.84167 type:complete len:310 (+) Transcript_56586:139-1068(+)
MWSFQCRTANAICSRAQFIARSVSLLTSYGQSTTRHCSANPIIQSCGKNIDWNYSDQHSLKRVFSSIASSTTESSNFTNILPLSRLGVSHKTLGSYLASIYPDVARTGVSLPRLKSKEYTLIVVTESRLRRILLGRKLRGFGEGFFNSFGGHLDYDIDPTPTHGAVRELAEEANINIPLDIMNEGAVGTLRFTFDDKKEKQMVVNLYRVDLVCEKDSQCDSSRVIRDDEDGMLPAVCINPSIVRACDEMEPQWFDNWDDIPLNNMFADDSIWLTKILSSDRHLRFDGWFHFCPGGTEINSIMHHHLVFK